MISLKPARDERIDLLRGFCVVVMIFGHLGWRALETHFRVGFVTIAEGFFLLSGATLGVVAARLAEPERARAFDRRLLRRALWIYTVHLAAVAASKALAGPLFPPRELRRYWARENVEPIWTWLSFDQPSVLNVLPRYALLLVLAPAALRLARRGRHDVLLALSLALWLAQLVTRGALLIPGFEQSRASYPSASWQLLFFGGLALFHRLRSCQEPEGEAGGKAVARRVAVALSGALTLAFVLLAARPDLVERLASAWISRPLLGPLRLLNLVAVAIVVGAFVDRYRGSLRRAFGWLLLPFGQNALPAFILHIPLVWAMLALPLGARDNTLRKPVAAALILLLLVLIRHPNARRWLAP